MTNTRQLIKRVLDIELALVCITVLAPTLALLALLVWRFHGAPVLFRQARPGLDGRLFDILKFRTMTDDRDDAGRLLPNHVRLTRFGRFLRATSLDELPELINVLQGSMSLVGPRPLRSEYLDHYTPAESQRHAVRPGVTGLAQVSGRNAVSWEAKMRYDLEYVDSHTLWLDVWILGHTVLKIFDRTEVVTEGGDAIPPTMKAPPGKVPAQRAGRDS